MISTSLPVGQAGSKVSHLIQRSEIGSSAMKNPSSMSDQEQAGQQANPGDTGKGHGIARPQKMNDLRATSSVAGSEPGFLENFMDLFHSLPAEEIANLFQ